MESHALFIRIIISLVGLGYCDCHFIPVESACCRLNLHYGDLMLRSAFVISVILLNLVGQLHAEAKHKLLFFSKSSGFEHDVISWKKGKPSFAEKIFIEIGVKHGWEFEFSKDGSKFSPEYLKGFDAVIFYTTGNLITLGKDKEPAMTPEGKQALFDYVKNGGGFIGLHSASDTFHTNDESSKGADRYVNHGEDCDPYICLLGGEFIIHGDQQVATNKVINPAFPGFSDVGESFAFNEEWYSLKDFRSDIHVLTVIDSPKMKGPMYDRPPFPNTWARTEGKGRVFYTSMGHREDVWTNSIFQNIVIGAIQWTTGELAAETKPNLDTAAPGAMTNPKFNAPAPRNRKKKRQKKNSDQGLMPWGASGL